MSAALVLIGVGPARATPAVPNDPGFPLQWGDANTGQSIPAQRPPKEELGPGIRGTPFADVSASEAWGVTTGSPAIVIAEVDTGVDYVHPDLAANIWSNPHAAGKCSLGASGCLNLQERCEQGTHGYDVLDGSCVPMDEDTTYGGHGTHVAGIMGAVGGNELGVAGMNWHTTVLPVKWLDSAEPEGESNNLLKALRWLIALKREEPGLELRVVNDSATFRGTSPKPELKKAIEELGEAGVLFVVAAGNAAVNENREPTYPCGFDLANEICVTATNNRDELPSWANYGSEVVQLAAPGVTIYSTLREEHREYGFLSGSSMAAAQVSGAAALILSAQPSLSVEALKADILEHVDRLPWLEDKVTSGGRLDVCAALPGCTDSAPTASPPPSAPAPAPAPPPPAAPARLGSSSPPEPAPPALISGLTVAPHGFKATAGGPTIASARIRTGASVSYTDSEPSFTEFTVLAARAGVRDAANRCLAPPRRRTRRSARRCVRYVLAGRFIRHDAAGGNRFRFSAHIDGSSLAPGRYWLRAAPMFAGREGSGASAGFRVER